MANLICAECNCSPKTCSGVIWKCNNCIKKLCCCIMAHTNKVRLENRFQFLQHLFFNIKKIFIAALGIEILCIISAEIGETIGLSLFGFNPYGILIAYLLGFVLAGFSTFMTILGRYDFEKNENVKQMRGCCSFLEENSNKGFIYNLVTTFLNFKRGFTKFVVNWKEPQMKTIFKASMVILITAESACIITAETVTILFYQYSIFLAIPLALVIGTFTLTIVESVRKIRRESKDGYICENINCMDCSSDLKSNFIKLSEFKRLDRDR